MNAVSRIDGQRTIILLDKVTGEVDATVSGKIICIGHEYPDGRMVEAEVDLGDGVVRRHILKPELVANEIVTESDTQTEDVPEAVDFAGAVQALLDNDPDISFRDACAAIVALANERNEVYCDMHLAVVIKRCDAISPEIVPIKEAGPE